MPWRTTLTVLLGWIACSAPGSAGELVIANQRDHSLQIVSLAEGSLAATITVGLNGHEVALSRDGRFAYVPVYGDSGLGRRGSDGRQIDVVDLDERRIVDSIDLGEPVRPHSIAVLPDGNLIVTAELANAVFVVNPQQREVAARVSTQRAESHMLAISSDGARAYTANVESGSVSVIDLKAGKVEAVVAVANRIQRVAISPDGKSVFTHDITQPRVAEIDAESLRVRRWIDVPGIPFASSVTPDGRRLLVIAPSGDGPADDSRPSGRLYVVDLASGKLAGSLELDGNPVAVAIAGDGRRAYLTCLAQGKVAVIDLIALKAEASITLTPGVDGIAVR